MRALCAMFLLLGAVPARADDLGLARELFVRGKAELDSGLPDAALSDLKAAYVAKPAPSLLFYIGEAHDKAGHSREALDYYQRYLAALPAGPMQKQAAARIADLQPAHKLRTLDLDAIDLKRPARPAHPAKVSRTVPKRPASALLTSALPALPAPAARAAPAALSTPEALPRPEAAAAPEVTPTPEAALPLAAAAPPAATAEAPAEPSLPLPIAPAPVEAWTVRPDQPSSRPLLAQVSPVADRAPLPVADAAPRMPPTGLSRHSAAKQGSAINYLSYTARLLVPGGFFTSNYATTTSPAHGTLYTHGLAVGRQSEYFRNAVYLGFGTEVGGPNETLQRYEVSWQCIWSALGSSALFSPYLGFRLGGMMVKSELLTGGSLKPGVVGAALGGVELQLRHFVLSAGLGYDENLGPTLSRSDASLSGYSFDLGATVRF